MDTGIGDRENTGRGMHGARLVPGDGTLCM